MRRTVVFWIFLLAPAFALAQVTDDFDDFAPQSSFESFQQKMEQRFSDFQDTINSRFAKELSRQWIEYECFDGEVRARKPKPAQLPVAPPPHELSSDELPATLPSAPIAPTPSTPLPAYELPSNDSSPRSSLKMPLSFFSQPLFLNFPPQYLDLQLNGVLEKSVSVFWKSLACDGFNEFLSQFRSQQVALQLNDWGMFELAKSCAQQIFAGDYAEQTVLTVFILNQLGYSARVGRVGEQLVCLLPTVGKVYGVPYLKMPETLLYVFSLYPKPAQSSSIFTYTMQFSHTERLVDLHLRQPLRFNNSPVANVFSAKFCGENISLPISESVIRFYEKYPQTDLEVYANALPYENWSQQVKAALGSALDEKNEYEKVALLLSFLHKNFSYQTDEEQFGCEKSFFCEENFYYPANDCEDRSVLFSNLVRNLVGLDVILLDYPDHIATAVHFSDASIPGDYYFYQAKKFIVCDPTYTGAAVGEPMPQYKNIRASIVPLAK